ncbi:MAG: CsgG/HfaB family protein [Fidelibacterota bacterium]
MIKLVRPSVFHKSLCSVLAVAVLMFSLPVKGVAQEKMNVAVLDMDGRGISALEAATLTDRLRSEMVELGYFQVVERGQMEMVLQEQGFQQTGCTSAECAVEVGKLLGVEKMVAGSIGKIGALYTIDVRMFDVTTGGIEKVSKREHRGDVEGLIDLLEIVSKDLAGVEVEVAEVEKTEPAKEAEAEAKPEEPKKKGGFGRLLLGTVLLAAVGGGAYYYLTVLQGPEELPGAPPAPPPTPGQ